jgi:hypothetical protein
MSGTDVPPRRVISAYIDSMNVDGATQATRDPSGMTAMAIFLFFGAATASLAGTGLVWRGTALDRMWELNPRAYAELAPLGRVVGIPFVLLGVTLAVAGAGWLKGRRWGWWLTMAIVATQVIGNLVGHFVEGGIGATIAGSLLFYLLRSKVVRTVFKAVALHN